MNSVATTDDQLLGGRVILRQPATGYRVAIDPVLLAAAVAAQPGARVLDAGCGTGAAMFCLAARCADVDVTGLEQNAESVALARQALVLNKLEARARVVEADLAIPPADFRNAFDIVMTNPPFTAAGTPPPDRGRAAAHMEGDLPLSAWLDACLACLKPKGRLVVIHRADRLTDVLDALKRGTGDIHIVPIYPKAGEAARRVIVDAGKGRRSPDTLLPGLVLHEAGGAFTSVVNAVLRDAAPLA